MERSRRGVRRTLQQEEECSHQEPERQAVAAAQGEEIEHVRIQVQEDAARTGDRRACVPEEDQRGKTDVHRIAEQVGQPQDELAAAGDQVRRLGQQRVQEVIGRDFEAEDGEQVGVEDRRERGIDVAMVGGRLVISQGDARRSRDRKGEETQAGPARQDLHAETTSAGTTRFISNIAAELHSRVEWPLRLSFAAERDAPRVRRTRD